MRGWLAFAACILLAGCSQAPAAETSESSTTGAPESAARDETLLPPGAAGPAAPNTPDGNATGEAGDDAADEAQTQGVDPLTAPWWAISTTASDAGGVAGFRWTIPAGALHTASNDLPTLSLAFAPLVDETRLPSELEMHFFTVKQGKAVQLGGVAYMPISAVFTGGPLAINAPTEYTPTFVPAFVRLGADGMAEGDELGIVLSAKGGTGPAGFAFRALDHVYDFSKDEAEETSKEMVENLAESGQGALLAPFGTGTGSALHLYEELDVVSAFVGGVGTYHVELWTTPDSHASVVPPVVAGPAVRDIAFSAKLGMPNGWGQAYGLVYQFGGVTTFEGDAACFGEMASSSTPSVGAAGIPLRFPILYASGDGTGDCSLTFDIVLANAYDWAIVIGELRGYGATLGTLIGATPEGTSYQTIQAAPTATILGNAMVLDGPAGRLVLPGVVPQAS